MKAMRKCVLCPSHEYEYCTKCKDKSIIESWRLLFDKESCRDIYHILSEFAFGRLSADDAKNQLDNYEMPNLDDMQTALRKNYEEVLSQASIRPSKSKNIVDISTSAKDENYLNEKIDDYSNDIISEEEPAKPVRRRRSFRRNI